MTAQRQTERAGKSLETVPNFIIPLLERCGIAAALHNLRNVFFLLVLRRYNERAPPENISGGAL